MSRSAFLAAIRSSAVALPGSLLAMVVAWMAVALPAIAAPFTPTADSQVLELVPSRTLDPAARERLALRQALVRQPRDVDSAARLAWLHIEAAFADGDPRHAGQAQAALAPWWTEPAPPPRVRVLRAVLAQYEHRFEPALADLDAVLAADPRDAQARAWQAAVHMVRADYPAARQSCEQLAPQTTRLTGVACLAQVDAATGHAAAALAALRSALAEDRSASADERVWALTRLAETEERLGANPAAEAAFVEALAESRKLGRDDIYLLAAYADFLLDRGRPAEVATLLKDRGRADVLLLRQALAAQALGDASREKLSNELAARFAAAAQRGDTTHAKEEARWLLGLRAADTAARARALDLAVRNFAVQREPADARLLLEAALVQRDRAAAAPALKWRSESTIESAVLADLATRVGALP
jgi:hypothetical protein